MGQGRLYYKLFDGRSYCEARQSRPPASLAEESLASPVNEPTRTGEGIRRDDGEDAVAGMRATSRGRPGRESSHGVQLLATARDMGLKEMPSKSRVWIRSSAQPGGDALLEAAARRRARRDCRAARFEQGAVPGGCLGLHHCLHQHRPARRKLRPAYGTLLRTSSGTGGALVP